MSDDRDLVSKDTKTIQQELTSSMNPPTWKWFLLVGFLGLIVIWGGIAWGYQIKVGMGAAGINLPVMWGFYIVSFVFWVGLSHSGTMVSAILRLAKANWRRPILRGAEALTVFTILVAGTFPMIHLGRPWKLLYFLPIPNQRGLWPNFRSPLLWDIIAITTYIIGSSLFLYLGMLPDLAIVRDRSSGWRKQLYSVLAMGWRGSAHEWRVFAKASTLMAVLIIPVAVSVHSIVSWDFAMTLVPGWHSTIFAPYFVIGAIFSGVAAVITVMVVIRKAFHLEAYLRPIHFDNMGKILLVVSLLWTYFYFSEVLTTWYGHKPIEWEVFTFIAERYWYLLGLMVLGNSCITIPALCFKKVRRSIPAILIISLFVNVGMFIERFLIVVPTLSHRNVPFIWGVYHPTWVEISIMAAAFAGFALLYTLFSKFFPIVSINDVMEGEILRSKTQLGRTTLNTHITEEQQDGNPGTF
ncbi:MAG: polysulfide reductase [Nitrospirae bacterium CG_4_9_14_3_um_filter_53_35]|nr:MAG: polysulfide reductase [Nitrospirae bacterium CG2_30_53_67]PIS38041.1 MAG: polysulfide reductase [Nitrospirae bacterium CG08_land_8_20_14_0_20_52_24]PIV83169.1 MAG: polysulfide reductase [Nitrospirae bacterium CG17_big_fil_post_rev_8_21_14_2_50_50_9]PIW85278.1 MAG: polysulfide reductase [Nitrospirae bacterium CG_4_8_14_3_um_filter_50_41]PIX86553.1 MAG: polysulfide reductase [Nitrospirae bacterium CG_4_10_14_3_um_filter_53_41]PJA76653.1 MAG: polysulfide reductase [Nitrospirae bacterium C